MPAHRTPAPERGTTDDAALFLTALRRLAKATGDHAWLLRQNALDLAMLHNALFDAMFALLLSVGYDASMCTPVERTPAEREAIQETVQRLDPDPPPPYASATWRRARQAVQQSPALRAVVEEFVRQMNEASRAAQARGT